MSTLPDAVPSAANLQYYLDIVLEKYLLRKMVQTCTGIVGRVFDYEGEVDALAGRSGARHPANQRGARLRRERSTIKELVNRAITKIEEYHTNQGMLTGISTGFIDFDKMTTGLHEGEMIVVAARPVRGQDLAGHEHRRARGAWN